MSEQIVKIKNSPCSATYGIQSAGCYRMMNRFEPVSGVLELYKLPYLMPLNEVVDDLERRSESVSCNLLESEEDYCKGYLQE